MEVYDTGFGPMECYDTYLIFRLEADHLNTASARKILDCAKRHYGNKKYVFISDRSFPGNIDPCAYKEIDERTMVGLSIVSDVKNLTEIAKKEIDLYGGAFTFFPTLEKAVLWAKTVL